MLSANQRRNLERILTDLKEVQADMHITDAYTRTVVPQLEDAEGYVGEAIGAVGMALGRLVP
jgi:hypothetical protein